MKQTGDYSLYRRRHLASVPAASSLPGKPFPRKPSSTHFTQTESSPTGTLTTTTCTNKLFLTFACILSQDVPIIRICAIRSDFGRTRGGRGWAPRFSAGAYRSSVREDPPRLQRAFPVLRPPRDFVQGAE